MKHEIWNCAGCGEPTTTATGKVRQCECEREQEAEWVQEERERENATPSRIAEYFASDR